MYKNKIAILRGLWAFIVEISSKRTDVDERFTFLEEFYYSLRFECYRTE